MTAQDLITFSTSWNSLCTAFYRSIRQTYGHVDERSCEVEPEPRCQTRAENMLNGHRSWLFIQYTSMVGREHSGLVRLFRLSRSLGGFVNSVAGKS